MKQDKITHLWTFYFSGLLLSVVPLALLAIQLFWQVCWTIRYWVYFTIRCQIFWLFAYIWLTDICGIFGDQILCNGIHLIIWCLWYVLFLWHICHVWYIQCSWNLGYWFQLLLTNQIQCNNRIRRIIKTKSYLLYNHKFFYGALVCANLDAFDSNIDFR